MKAQSQDRHLKTRTEIAMCYWSLEYSVSFWYYKLILVHATRNYYKSKRKTKHPRCRTVLSSASLCLKIEKGILPTSKSGCVRLQIGLARISFSIPNEWIQQELPQPLLSSGLILSAPGWKQLCSMPIPLWLRGGIWLLGLYTNVGPT